MHITGCGEDLSFNQMLAETGGACARHWPAQGEVARLLLPNGRMPLRDLQQRVELGAPVRRERCAAGGPRGLAVGGQLPMPDGDRAAIRRDGGQLGGDRVIPIQAPYRALLRSPMLGCIGRTAYFGQIARASSANATTTRWARSASTASS